MPSEKTFKQRRTFGKCIEFKSSSPFYCISDMCNVRSIRFTALLFYVAYVMRKLMIVIYICNSIQQYTVRITPKYCSEVCRHVIHASYYNYNTKFIYIYNI